MSAFEQRAERLHALLTERKLDLLLVTNLVNVRYLCGFTGTNGLCVVGPGARHFVTDFRYLERARNGEVQAFEVVKGERDLLADAVRLATEHSGNGALRLGFEDDEVSVARHAKLRSLLSDAAELVPAAGLVQKLRRIKDDGELALMRRAAEVADEAYRWLIDEHGLTGHSEREVTRALVRRCEDSGADEVSFLPIVAAAANGALPHALPGDAEIPRDTLVVVDMGCRIEGYCSDCTRTFATGRLDDEATEVYELMRAAQAAATEAVRAGAGGAAVDAVAREAISAAGRGDQFGHGLGHGVGLEVHEAPRLGPSSEDVLEENNCVTVEPGVYVPGKFGVRIEDLVVVGPEGCEVMTSIPRELITI
jgi:Xaa-Pro aminopeptidase